MALRKPRAGAPTVAEKTTGRQPAIADGADKRSSLNTVGSRDREATATQSSTMNAEAGGDAGRRGRRRPHGHPRLTVDLSALSDPERAVVIALLAGSEER